jgi:maltooligosyltrehalose trehalohydrolase
VQTGNDAVPEWRRLPIGAEMAPGGGVHFRLWASRATRVAVKLADRRVRLHAEGDGYHSGTIPDIGAGTLYMYELDEGSPRPDPASRFQPTGPHGASEVVDPGAFPWTDGAWPGVTREGQVVYELHVGTFTTAGTWESASRELP